MEMMAALPALIGAGGGIANMINGAPANRVQPGMNPLQMVGNMFPAAVSQGYDRVAGAPNIYSDTLGRYGGVVNDLMNNPGANNMTGGAWDASKMGANVANNYMGLGDFLSTMGKSLTPYAGAILNQGFDPQQQLYGRTQQQLQEQVRAGQSARGTAMSPFGAGIENKAMSDFNIDWQNNLLNRMATAGQGAGQLLDQAGRDITGGASLQGQAPGMLSQTSMLPYQAFNMIGGNQLGALGQWGQQGMLATAQPQQQLQDFYQLLGLGNAGSNVMNNMFKTQLDQSQMGFNQGQQQGQNLGNSLAGLGKAMGGGGGGNAFMPSASFMSGGMGWG